LSNRVNTSDLQTSCCDSSQINEFARVRRHLSLRSNLPRSDAQLHDEDIVAGEQQAAVAASSGFGTAKAVTIAARQKP
jgi:hypothetical protein